MKNMESQKAKRTWTPKEGEIILVRDYNDEDWCERKFICMVSDYYACEGKYKNEPQIWEKAKLLKQKESEDEFFYECTYKTNGGKHWNVSTELITKDEAAVKFGRMQYCFVRAFKEVDGKLVQIELK